MGKRPTKETQKSEYEIFENVPVLALNLKDKCIGFGSFAYVFRISPRRVIKIFDPCVSKEVINSEIEGSKCSKHSLPVLKIVKVKSRSLNFLYGVKGKRIYWGLVKRYIPYEVSEEEADQLRKQLERSRNEKVQMLAADCYEQNVRKDSRGSLWIVDTQLVFTD